MFVPLRKAMQYYGVCGNTLRKWADNGKVAFTRSPSGQRLFELRPFEPTGRRKVVYCRVSSRGQSDDLKSQVACMKAQFPNHELVTDVGSGLNWKRRGFTALLESVMCGDVEELVIAHRDRLCRFGFELFEHIARKNNTRIVVLDDSSLSPREELVRDLVSIIHVFSCRISGMRKYATTVSKDTGLLQKSGSTKSTPVSGAE